MKHLAASFRGMKGSITCSPLTFILSPRGEDKGARLQDYGVSSE